MNSSSSFTRALNPDRLISAGIIVNLAQNLIMMTHTSQSKAHRGKTLVKSCPTDLDPRPAGWLFLSGKLEILPVCEIAGPCTQDPPQSTSEVLRESLL